MIIFQTPVNWSSEEQSDSGDNLNAPVQADGGEGSNLKVLKRLEPKLVITNWQPQIKLNGGPIKFR